MGEHQWALERLCRLQLKEKTKHLLLLRETLKKNGMTVGDGGWLVGWLVGWDWDEGWWVLPGRAW